MKPWIVRTSLALNLLILALCAGVARSRPDNPVRARATRRGQNRFFESFPGAQDDVVMLGDSITAGGEWSEMFPGVPIRNRGISGDTTSDVLLRLDPIVAAKPAAVFLKIGTNDLNRGPDRGYELPIGIEQIVSRIQAGSPTTAIFLQSVLPREAAMREEVGAYNRRSGHCRRASGVVLSTSIRRFSLPTALSATS